MAETVIYILGCLTWLLLVFAGASLIYAIVSHIAEKQLGKLHSRIHNETVKAIGLDISRFGGWLHDCPDAKEFFIKMGIRIGEGGSLDYSLTRNELAEILKKIKEDKSK